MINGTGTGSPSPMTVSAYSPGTYVSTMTDFFEARSAGTDEPPASPPATDHDTCLFSPSKNDQPRADQPGVASWRRVYLVSHITDNLLSMRDLNATPKGTLYWMTSDITS
jgi:hypothetical protein